MAEHEMKQRSYKSADSAAQQVLRRCSDTVVSDNDVLQCLRRLPFPQNRLRRNVRPDDASFVYSQCAGLTTLMRGQGPTISRIARKCPNVVQLLSLFVRQAEDKAEGCSAAQAHESDVSGLRYLRSQFAFTSITLNYNYAATPHRDNSHIDGLARVIALGHFSGGELAVEGRGVLDVRHRWVDFDGRLLHHVQPFEGERYSLVYFAHEAALLPENASSDDSRGGTSPGFSPRRALESLGMRWPTCAVKLAPTTSSESLTHVELEPRPVDKCCASDQRERHLLCLSAEGGRIASASNNAFVQHAVHEFLALSYLYGEKHPFVPNNGHCTEANVGTDANALLRGPVSVWLRPNAAQAVCRRLVSLDLYEIWAQAPSLSELSGSTVLQHRLVQLCRCERSSNNNCTEFHEGESCSFYHVQQAFWGHSHSPSRKRARRDVDSLLQTMPAKFHRIVGTRLLGKRILAGVGVAGAPRPAATGPVPACLAASLGPGVSPGTEDLAQRVRSLELQLLAASVRLARLERACNLPLDSDCIASAAADKVALQIAFREQSHEKSALTTSAASDATIYFFSLLQVEGVCCFLACEPDYGVTGTRQLHNALVRMQVSSRPSQGETPLRPQLALLAANMACVQARSVVLDPFVGSGSLLLGAAHIGAHCFGSDLDEGALFGAGSSSAGSNECGTFANFDIFSLPRPELVCANILRSPLRTCGLKGMIHRAPWVDAIITDPPYGMRKARHAAHSRGRKHDEASYDERVDSGEELHAAVCAMVAPVLRLAAAVLVDGGRIVMLFPTFSSQSWWHTLSEQQLPRHEELELVCVCEERFKHMSRNLVCMQRRPRSGHACSC